MTNLTILLAYILLAGWMGYVGAAVITHSMMRDVPGIIKPVKLDPLGRPMKPVWV
jgi:hypothetical protein